MSLFCFVLWLRVTTVNINIALGYNSDIPLGILYLGVESCLLNIME